MRWSIQTGRKQPATSSRKQIAVGCRTLFALSVLVGSCWHLSLATAQDEKPGESARTAEALATSQDAISMRFQRFEKTLLQMAEYLRKTDPARADLLIRVIGRAKEDRIAQQMNQVVELLEGRQLGDATDRQAEVVGHLQNLLKLLQSEDRLSELEKEKQRIGDLLKDLNKVIAREKDVRVATERREDARRLIDRQQKVADDTGRLVDKIDQQDAEHNQAGESQDEPTEAKSGEGQPSESGESESGESEPGESESGESEEDEPQPGEPSESKPSDAESDESKSEPGKSSESQSEPSESESGEGKPQESKPSDSQPSEGQSSPQQPSGESSPSESSQSEAERTPGRNEVEQARQELEKAIEELKRKRLDDASEHQDDAIAKLQQAKEKLEEILRQLREEEQELLLAGLEARFQKMLALQLVVHEATTGLAATPRNEWGSRHFGRARELANQEDEIALEAARALALLREEGSSVAFPEAIEQLQDDMRTVARRLETPDVGELTQMVQRDIIEALEELIEALQREMEKKGDQSQNSPQNGQGQPPEFALVDKLAELKMLRSLQMRVNRRTRRLGSMAGEDPAADADLVGQLQELSLRQARIQSATYDLSIGRNR